MISGYASLNGTSGFLSKFALAGRESPMFCASPIALGTHLGEMKEEDSVLYREGIEYGLLNGLNFIDTAINYRGMRSERDVGHVVKSLIKRGLIKRDEVIVSTKGGIIPGDIEANLVPTDYLQKVLLEGGVIQKSDVNIVDTHRHVLAPSYYRFAIDTSRKHLHLETIDIYYIHNPEISMMILGPAIFYKQLEKLFSFLENQVRIGNIQCYGLATWFGLLKDPTDIGYISIKEVLDIAKRVAGEGHHFKFIQFPLNKHMKEGVLKQNQKTNGKWLSVIEAAQELGIYSTTSAPFHLGKAFDGESDYRSMLMEVTSTKGVFSTMVGMKKIEHIEKNIQILQSD
ncbi:aldo/keto reductase [Rossellomorea sp. SC111]|uniref:aldo/keto reductase n=1 Tax=Rossellomorea sp. SC111 TaxID=2968985 RepID=UPI00215A63CC|nr:aldo/keto reductase [Rossellomorea sp. SC111]MCR8848201.1 aldo/keto reductase [Rossellomorea sp. SC111]